MATNFEPCSECGFQLWVGVADLGYTKVGLYDDSRFPGRLIVSMKSHQDSFEDLDEALSAAFVQETRTASRLLKEVSGATRVNIAILGNDEHHLHAHLIPRWNDLDASPRRSPWDDPRHRCPMDSPTMRLVHSDLVKAFDALRDARHVQNARQSWEDAGVFLPVVESRLMTVSPMA